MSTRYLYFLLEISNWQHDLTFHFLVICNLNSSCNACAVCCALSLQSCPTLETPWTVAARLLCPWESPGKNTGVGCHALLQGIFPTQGLKPGLPHYRQIHYHLSHQGRPRLLEWVSRSLLQRIFLTQELNQDLLHCKQIIYQVNYQGSPFTDIHIYKPIKSYTVNMQSFLACH